MKKLKAIMDTWTIVEKFNIPFKQTDDNTVEISEADYKRVWDAYGDKKYIESLTNLSRGLCSHGYIY